MPTIDLQFPAGSYSITIECGCLSRLGEHVMAVAPHARALLAVDANLHSTHGIAAKNSLQRSHCEPVSVSLIAQETSKTLAAAQEVYSSMIAARLERQSPVIALGGGIVGDVVGFAAA